MSDFNTLKEPRKGCVDLWNAKLLKGACYTMNSDMPVCPCISETIPNTLISYDDAKHQYKTKISQNPNFREDAYIHFYIDDQKFDGKRSSIWNKPFAALEIIKHFSGIISPDFSTYADFPDPLKRINTYKMRAFGYWISSNGIPVINNVRWGTEESWTYCFDGIPYNSIVAIGTVGSGLRRIENRPIFEAGLREMVARLNPKVIIVYGSSKYKCFKELELQGTKIVTFPSKTYLKYAQKRRASYE